MGKYYEITEQSRAFAKHVLVPEVERLDNAITIMAALLQNPHITLDEIADTTNLSLTELRYDGWEKLYAYIRDLERQITNLTSDVIKQNKKMRELVIFVEETSSNIVKLYRDSSQRTDYNR